MYPCPGRLLKIAVLSGSVSSNWEGAKVTVGACKPWTPPTIILLDTLGCPVVENKLWRVNPGWLFTTVEGTGPPLYP